MLSFKGLNRAKNLILTGLAILSVMLTTACIRPLYGTSAGGSAVQRELAAIEVAPLNDLAGHYLREELLFNLSGGNYTSLEHKYKLFVTTSENTVSAAVDTTSGRADAAALRLTAQFKLIDLNEKTLFESSAFATASIDRLSQRFAAVRAQRDSRIRVSKDVADQIQLSLAAYFSSRS
ncbi:MAG: LPS assembly lipoprotein LptE [Beijerinckiaceae bacterium]|nr:LPS assembly lipoprotein LptE [Beijerinckiaceae bacterium]